ncbi:MAG: hypothetical protein IPI90_04070 [Saprospiraceae bacterium]|nr:hypothetical protein [Candidatus Vicinibacter affinis]
MNDSSYNLLTTNSKVVGDTIAYIINLRDNFHKLVNTDNNSGIRILSTNNILVSDSIDIGKFVRHHGGVFG